MGSSTASRALPMSSSTAGAAHRGADDPFGVHGLLQGHAQREAHNVEQHIDGRQHCMAEKRGHILFTSSEGEGEGQAHNVEQHIDGCQHCKSEGPQGGWVGATQQGPQERCPQGQGGCCPFHSLVHARFMPHAPVGRASGCEKRSSVAIMAKQDSRVGTSLVSASALNRLAQLQ